MTSVERDNGCAQIPYPRQAEHDGLAIFAAAPGAANEQAGVELVADLERHDLIGDQARAELAALSDRGRAALAAQGRHVSDRLAAEQQDRRDQIAAADAVTPDEPGWYSRHLATQRARDYRERQTSARPDDFVGIAPLSDTGYQRWIEHCAAGYGCPPHVLMDDLAYDAWLDDQASACPPPDELYAGSPDLDDYDDAAEDAR